MDKLTITINPEFQSLIPPLSPDEYNQLEENLLAEGCRDALVTWQGVLVDGHNRYELCVKHDIPYKTIEKEFKNNEQVKEWIVLNQFGRRNLSDYQRSELALKLKPIIEARAKENQGTRNDLTSVRNLTNVETESTNQKTDKSNLSPIDTKKQLAQIAGVSHDTIHKVETIQNKAPEPIKEAVKSKEISINKAHDLTKKVKDLPEEEKNKKAEELLAAQKQLKETKKAAKSDKSSPNPTKQDVFPEKDETKETEHLADALEQKNEEIINMSNIQPQADSEEKLIRILAAMVSEVGKYSAQVELELQTIQSEEIYQKVIDCAESLRKTSDSLKQAAKNIVIPNAERINIGHGHADLPVSDYNPDLSMYDNLTRRSDKE